MQIYFHVNCINEAPHLFHICRHNVILLLVSSSDRLRLATAPRLGVPDDIRGSCLAGAAKK